MPHLSPSEIGNLVNAFATLPFQYDANTRGVLLAGIPAAYVGLLPAGLPPVIQLMSDLNNMNQIERLADGTVPLRSWLSNITTLAGITEASKVFMRAYDEVGHRTSGAPRVPVAALPEIKEKVVHRDDMVGIGFVRNALAVAAAVAKMTVPRFEGGEQVGVTPVNYLGTGWLLTSDLMVTNHHVVNARNEGEPSAADADLRLQARAATVEFDYDGDDSVGAPQPILRLEAWDEALDYAILRLQATSRTPLRLAARPLTLQAGEYPPVNIVQHPRGMSKRYAIRNNLVSGATADEIRYFSDTDIGSSGSPVLDDAWRVVALHRGHTFVDDVSFQGRTTAWVNVGTPIHAIVADLKGRYPALAAELP